MQTRHTPSDDATHQITDPGAALPAEMAAIIEGPGSGSAACSCGRGGACCGGSDCRFGGSERGTGRFISPFKVTMAFGLATLVGSFMVFKPAPQGVLASDATRLTQIAPEELRQIGLGAGIAQPAGAATGGLQADDWRSLGTLESDGLLIRIETRQNRFGESLLAYTAIDRTGTELATRVTIEDLRSQFPKLDWDSLTAATPGRLMLADDQDQR